MRQARIENTRLEVAVECADASGDVRGLKTKVLQLEEIGDRASAQTAWVSTDWGGEGHR